MVMGVGLLNSTQRYERYSEIDLTAPNTSHAFVLELVGYNKRTLELGCAGGHLTRVLADRGCRVTGIEIDPSMALHAGRIADDVMVADLEDLEWADNLEAETFDVVVAADVLEHLRDPTPVLRACRPLLKPSGVLVVSIPNIAHADVCLSLLQGRFVYEPWGLLDVSHLRFFTKESIDALLYSAGFIPIETRRTVVPVFGSELGIDRQSVSKETLDEVLREPEAETYQFVVKAVLDNGDTAVHGLTAQCAHLQRELQLEQVRSASTTAALEETRQQLGVVESQYSEIVRELQAISRTRTFRYAEPLRRIYRRLRDLTAP
jgi:2-polyprenyl-3-methyl-5-hydroxy-6-metoxy-1,4-benzoquinol methylase